MNEPVHREEWSHLALVASLSTAAEVAISIRDRRMGADPSDQETDGAVLSYLSSAIPELRHLLIRLRTLMLGRGGPNEGSSSVVRRFPELMLLLRASRVLHRIHQRLLSLYPAVSDELIEEVRLLESGAAQLLRGRTAVFEGDELVFVERALAFVDRDITTARTGGGMPEGTDS